MKYILILVFSLNAKAQLLNPPTDKTVKFSDITTGNFSTSRHGFVPKGTNTGSSFLRDDATWAVPAGGGGGSTNMALNAYTANGVSTTFIMSSNPSVEENTFVFLSGVYQNKSTYSVSGTSLTFSSAPVSGTSVEVMVGTVSGTSGSATTPAGASGTIQYNSGGSFGGVSNTSVDDGNFVFSVSATQPSSPSSGFVKLFGDSVGGRAMLSQSSSSGSEATVQPHVGRNRSGWWQPLGNSSTVPITTGIAAASVSGTATVRNVATTNILTRARRLGYVSGAGVSNTAAVYWPAAGQQFTVGNGSLGGIHSIFRLAVTDAATVSGARMFAGWRSVVTAPTNVEPETQVNQFGLSQIASDASQWYIVYGGSAAQTKIGLGTAIGAPTLTNTLWEVSFYAPPSTSNTVSYSVINLGSGAIAYGTLTGVAGTAIPASTTFLAPAIWRNNNTTALAVGIDVSSVYIETDY